MCYYSFTPSNYNLAIDGIIFSPTWTFEGLVTISGSVAAAKEIVINAHQLKLHEAQLKTDGTIQTAHVQYQEEQQRVQLLFDEDFPASQHAELVIRFQGLINDVSYTSFSHSLPYTLIRDCRRRQDSRGQSTSPPSHQRPPSRITRTMSITTCSPLNFSHVMPVAHFPASMSRH